MRSDLSRLSLSSIVCASANEVSSRVGDKAAVLDLDAGLVVVAPGDAR